MEHGKEISRDLDIVQELKESYEDLNELVAEDPLNVEVQKVCCADFFQTCMD
jgi:hypothetical protein